MIYGIDVSGAQRGIDIVTLKKLNPDLAFVGVKSTGSGGAYINDDCDRVMQQCFSIGLPCFTYDFTEDGVAPPADPAKYAESCFSHIQGYVGKAGFVFDWESTVAGSTLMSNAAYAAAAVKRMQELHPSPGFYIDYRTMTNGAPWGLVAATNVWKWRASYFWGYQQFNGFGSPDWSVLSPTPAWPDAPAMWQYTSSGRLNGWNGPLDFNVFNGTEDQLLTILGVKSAPAPEAYPGQREDDVVLDDMDLNP